MSQSFDSYKKLSKFLIDASQIVNTKLLYDEQKIDVFSKLSTIGNGYYHFEKEPIKLKRFVALPPAILDQYNNLQCMSFVGILEEINRAYITIDHRIILWNYIDGQDFVVFDELDQVIISVCLLKPKKGVFVEDIHFVLAIATTLEVIFLGIHFAGNNVYGEMSLYPTTFIIPSDNVSFLKMLATPSGLLFLCGKDGTLYEFDYHQKDGWFFSKCRKIDRSTSFFGHIFHPVISLVTEKEDPIIDIDFDESRNYLFTLSQNNMIQMYSLGQYGNSIENITKNTSVIYEASRLIQDNRLNVSKDLSLRGISVIPRTESDDIVLLAISVHGHRFYFRFDPYYKCLSVKFIRCCPHNITKPRDRVRLKWEPHFVESSSPHCVRSLFYRQGVLLLVDARQLNSDTLIAICQDTHPSDIHSPPEQKNLNTSQSSQYPSHFSSSVSYGYVNPSLSSPPIPTTSIFQLNESVQSHNIESRICAVKELPQSFYIGMTAACLFARGQNSPLAGLNEFATQHALPPRQFLCLTTAGLYTFIKPQPIHELRELLSRQYHNDNMSQVNHFFSRYSEVEACAMCLVIACSDERDNFFYNAPVNSLFSRTSLDVSFSKKRQSIGDMMNDESFLSDSLSPIRPTIVAKNDISDMALRFFIQFGGFPSTSYYPNAPTGMVGGMVSTGGIVYSHKHNALYLYFSRLLRPFWSWSISIIPIPGNPLFQRCRFQAEQLTCLRAPLLNLQHFFDNHYSDFDPWSAYRNLSIDQRQTEVRMEHSKAFEAEQESLRNLRLLLGRCIEVISLFMILTSQDVFSRLIASLPPKESEVIKNTTFSHFITTPEGDNMARSLISALIKIHSDDTTWMNRLNHECPHYFNTVELLRYRATESLNKAKTHRINSPEHRNHVEQALACYENAVQSPLFPFTDACYQLRLVHAYSAILRLALHRAHLLQEQKILTVSEYDLDPVPRPLNINDAQNLLKLCYECILQIFDLLTFNSYPIIESDDLKQYIPLEESQRIQIKNDILTKALCSNDEMFHEYLYKWLIDRKQMEYLFESDSPWIEQFLSSDPLYYPDLANYYLRKKKYNKAFILYSQLAYTNERKTSLDERLGFLTRAVTCSSNINESYDESGKIRESMALAMVQLKIYCRLEERLKELQQDDIADSFQIKKIQKMCEYLNDHLLNIGSLYDIARDFELWENCLSLIALTNDIERHSNPIEVLWHNIINREITKAVSIKQDWLFFVKQKLNDICSEFRMIPELIPVKFLVKTLEEYNHNHREQAEKGVIVRMLMQCGFPYENLLSSYHYILESSGISQIEFNSLITYSIHELISKWIQESSNINHMTVNYNTLGRIQIGKISELIDSCLQILQNHTSTFQPLINSFRNLQKQLRSLAQ